MSQRNLKGSESPWESAERGLAWHYKKKAEWGKRENVTFPTKRTRCGNVTQTYHFFLQLVVFPADQYHCFLEHWWESAREHMSVLDLTVHASWGKPTEGAQPQKHFKCQLEALKHISALQLWILKFCSAHYSVQQTQYSWFISIHFLYCKHPRVTIKGNWKIKMSDSPKTVISGSFLMRPSDGWGLSQTTEECMRNSPIEISVTWERRKGRQTV